jgi:hypothetical protein
MVYIKFRCCLSVLLALTLVVCFADVSLSAQIQNLPAGKPKKSAKQLLKKQSDANEYEPYRGTWYGIYFPKGWFVRSSLKSNKGEDESAFFTAQDSSAEFYVYCPRLSGKPTDIEINRATEEQLGQTIEELDGVRIRTVRIRAKDSTYTRYIEDTVAFIAGRRLVFGAKFRIGDGARLHNQDYVYFKQSFKKFTD